MNLKPNSVIYGHIQKIDDNQIVINTRSKRQIVITKKNITDFSSMNLFEIFEIGQKINFVMLSNNDGKTSVPSFKYNHPLHARSPFQYQLEETKNGYQNLKKHIEREIDKYNDQS